MSPINKEILHLALPSILANITVPIVGMTDTAVAGHLLGTQSAAAFIGAISVGAMMFNIIYWNFYFLRTGTGGLTAQAFGRGDMKECARIFLRGMAVSLLIALVTLALQCPLSDLTLLMVNATPEVEALAVRYFMIRVWAAPATVALMAFRGWFVGMQDSVSSMWTDLIINAVNVVLSIVLTFGIAGWTGLGFDGIALGTVIAQYSGLLYASLVSVFRYRRKVFSHFGLADIPSLLDRKEIIRLLKMNVDLLLRSLGMTGIYIGFTIISAEFGNTLLACSSIMMQLLMIFSYFTDGFAYAGEALTGRFLGAGDNARLRLTIRCVFLWSTGVSLVWTLIYLLAGVPLMRLITPDQAVAGTCAAFLPWLVAMPLAGYVPFTWDGIYLGATATRSIRNSMLGSVALFFAVWAVCRCLCLGETPLHCAGNLPLHLLFAAYFAHLLYRAAYLTVDFIRKSKTFSAI